MGKSGLSDQLISQYSDFYNFFIIIISDKKFRLERPPTHRHTLFLELITYCTLKNAAMKSKLLDNFSYDVIEALVKYFFEFLPTLFRKLTSNDTNPRIFSIEKTKKFFFSFFQKKDLQYYSCMNATAIHILLSFLLVIRCVILLFFVSWLEISTCSKSNSISQLFSNVART